MGVMTVREHQVTGSFTGTLSSTPSLTSFDQCMGIGEGEWSQWTAFGLADSSTNSLRGGLSFINGKGWCSHTLNPDEAYRSRMYCLMRGRFSLFGGHGSLGGSLGGSCLTGQLQGVSSDLGTPVFSHAPMLKS